MKWFYDGFTGSTMNFKSSRGDVVFFSYWESKPNALLDSCEMSDLAGSILACLNGEKPANQTEPGNACDSEGFPYWAQTAAIKILAEFCCPERHRYEEGITAKCMGMILKEMPKQTFKGVNITDLKDEAEKGGYERGLAEARRLINAPPKDWCDRAATQILNRVTPFAAKATAEFKAECAQMIANEFLRDMNGSKIVPSEVNDFDLIKEHEETIRKLQEQILAKNEIIRKLTA